MNNTAYYFMPFLFISSVVLPWFTVRKVKVEIEIVRLLFFKLFMHELIIRENSRHRKWPLFVLNAACSKGSWRELAEVLSLNITRLASYRMFPFLLDTVYAHHFSVIDREGQHAKEHFLICGVQGDFTRSLVKDPPTHLWTRQLKVLIFRLTWCHIILTIFLTQFAGVSNSSKLYKRGIRVCTGTGLGAALSTCLQESFYQISDRSESYLPAINRSQSPDW
jgi:hypothetical protein